MTTRVGSVSITSSLSGDDATLSYDVQREEMRTEISAKFTRARLEADLAAAGLRLETFLTDPQDLFALSLIRTTPS